MPDQVNDRRLVAPVPGTDHLRVEQGCYRCQASVLIIFVAPLATDPTQPDLGDLVTQAVKAGWKTNTAGEILCSDCR